MYGTESESDISNIGQLDGNLTNHSDTGCDRLNAIPPSKPESNGNSKIDKITAALSLPTVATYNLRSLFPKVGNFTTDMLERQIDCAFLSEIWENIHSKEHQYEIEKMLEVSGLKYVSCARPPNAKNGVSYGGAAIVVNLKNFSCEKLKVQIPNNLEVVWCLLKPKNQSARFKKIIACSFYSPPNKQKNSKMADHLVSTLQMLYAKYPDCGLILGADKNYMNIQPLLNCGLRLRQVVDRSTRMGAIIDIIIMNLSSYYNTPIIAPPICPDDPTKGKPSDHCVPVCTPHTDRYTAASRNYKIIKYRPLPDSSIRRFGEWIVNEGWQSVEDGMSPSEQVSVFEKLVQDKLDEFCPEKELKLSSQDKAFITSELKKLKRQKSREYTKRGKTVKYKELSKKFEALYKSEAKKYLDKNLEALKETKPGQAYSILKKMGSQPGDCIDANTFILPSHESLTEEESAEQIACHFAAISQEFPPLCVTSLPSHVQTKLQCSDPPPEISEYDTYCKIRAAKKPKSGVPNDLPKVITQEFSPELSRPVCRIIRNIVKTGVWPQQWKLEYISPLGKIPQPESEDDLRPISLTAFFSKVTEHFVVMWLLEYIKDKIDFRQYGGLKGNSITHYLIEFINFILSKQDGTDQIAVLACMVDFSKAFNRQNHNILLTKLCNMGVPGWLLRIVVAFLTDRKMIVRYRGKRSSMKSLPGGGPQGTLLGLLLFIVLINDVGFEGQENNAGDLITSKKNMKKMNEIHLKYVDDLTLAEAINLPANLVEVPDRPQPDNFHARTGHALMEGKSRVFEQLLKTQDYAEANDMIINKKKTRLMLFNPCTSKDFMPEVELNGIELEVVDELRLLGLIVRSDMKWHSNTENMVARGNKKLWMLRRLKSHGAENVDLVDVYVKQIRSLLELAAPAWQGAITQSERLDLERVQKCALHIIMGEEYESYRNALKQLNLEDLESRRKKLCLKFGKKAERHDKHSKWFKPNNEYVNTRQEKYKYCEVKSSHKRFKTSPISYLTSLLNEHYSEGKH